MIILMKTTIAYLQSCPEGLRSLRGVEGVREKETYYEIVYND